MKYIISLTSVPTRFKNELPKVLKHIKDNSEVDIVLSIPKEYRKSWSWVDSDIEHLKELATINIVDEDWGPATKLLGGIDWVKKNDLDVDGIITLDDDIIFTNFNLQLEHLLKTATEKPNTVITTGGLKLKDGKPSGVYNQQCDAVAGFMGVFYPKNFWKTDLPFTLLKELSDGFYSEDDAYFGAVAYKSKINIWSTDKKVIWKALTPISAVTAELESSRIDREIKLYKELIQKKMIKDNTAEIKDVTFCLTSCGRNDLLEKTLDSFFKYNTYPIDRYIIIEDSADPKVFEECEILNREKYDNKLEFVFNHEKLGQSASIDKAYTMVKTEYIFHCEEDWEFYRSGFVEDSIKVLKTQPKVIQAWIRPKNDRILNKIEPNIFTLPFGVSVRRVLPTSFIVKGANKDGTDMVIKDYMGFSWNPGVKRLKDWQELPNGYSGFKREHLIDQYYRDNGFIVVSLSKDDNDGYVKHIGWDKRVENTKH